MAGFIARIGNLVGDIELLEAKVDKPAVARARVAVTDRVLTSGGEWIDGATEYFAVSVRGQRAVVTAKSLVAGDPVSFAGDLTVKLFERRDGGQGRSSEVRALFLSADPRHHVVRVERHRDRNAADSVAVGSATGQDDYYDPEPDV